MKLAPDPHYRRRFPAEIISHAIWLYHVFSLSLRDVELLLAERGVVVSYESIRQWCRKFGQTFASRLRRRRPRPGDKWHMRYYDAKGKQSLLTLTATLPSWANEQPIRDRRSPVKAGRDTGHHPSD